MYQVSGSTMNNYSELALMANTSNGSSYLDEKLVLPNIISHEGIMLHHNSLDLNLHHQFGFDPKQEPSMHHLLHETEYCSPIFDNSPNPSILGLLNVFSGEQLTDTASISSTVLSEQQSNIEFADQAAILRDVFSCMPRNCSIANGYNLGGLDDGRQLESMQMNQKKQKRSCKGFDDKGSFKTERQRRERFSKKYEVLKSLIPNLSKPDRATIIADTINYINELQRTIKELKILVEKKRQRRHKSKRLTIQDEVAVDMESSSMFPDVDGGQTSLMGTLKSSWIQRKSKETFVDVRIIDDNVYIKLNQTKKNNCLLTASKVLDEMQLEQLHLCGGSIGRCHVFMFNSKIHEGSSVYAGAIAKKLIEAMDA